MSAKERNLYVRVKDIAGNDFLCPLEALKNPKAITDNELAERVDDATVQRYARDIKITD